MKSFFIVAALVLLAVAQDVQKESCKVGDKLNLQVDAPKPEEGDPITFEWTFIEWELAKKFDVFKFSGKNLKVNDDGSETSIFSIECTAPTNGTPALMNFILGDVTKLDDALQGEFGFDPTIMSTK